MQRTPNPDRLRPVSRDCPLCCFIVPPNILRRYSRDTTLDDATRKNLSDSFVETQRLRGLREAHRVASLADTVRGLVAVADKKPAQQLFDCKHTKALPGTPVAKPTGGFKTVSDTTAKVAEFYLSVLGRNSVDNQGFDLLSSLHYSKKYDNAFWNGQQMVYGDGDGKLFTEMYLSPDVIGHELTHGVTQYESGLKYEGESGALNESLSDVFGAVFNQWLNQWPVTEPKGWLIGAGIIAAPAKKRGFTALRDMLDPGASHNLSPQPDRYSKIDPTADVHDNSGVPNKAFALFASAVGGQAWGPALKVWYDVATGGQLHADATFRQFAVLSVASAKKIGGTALVTKLKKAWKTVEVPTT